MARESTEAGEATRERLLAVARERFAVRGYDGASVRAIAEAAGANVAAIAYHFGGKEGLYRAVIDRLYAELSALDAAAALAHPDPVRAVVETAWGFVRTHREAVRLLHRHVLDHERYHEASFERWLGGLMEAAVALVGALRPDLAPTGRRWLVLTVVHLLVRYALDDREQLATLLGTSTPDDLVVDGLVGLVRTARPEGSGSSTIL